ncbi:hypothetical protein [Geotalea uraniireducens]|uniref:hypothetical protein n=1 Tax=Geotalea uraniireducens TaxID=351604 RepID=UPI0024909331|nr:hypothetical protein [Geotalea uraniireducens]
MNDDYSDKLYKEYSSQREKLDGASLEAAGRYDRAILAISTGALALSVTFIEKIVSTPQTWTLFLLVPGWILLLCTIILQLLALASSQNATSEQIRILDQQYQKYFSAEDAAQAVKDGWIEPENPYVKRTNRLNIVSQITLIIGILLVLAFSSVNVCVNTCTRKEAEMADKPSSPKPASTTKIGNIRGSYTPPTNKLPPPPPPKSSK